MDRYEVSLRLPSFALAKVRTKANPNHSFGGFDVGFVLGRSDHKLLIIGGE